MKKRAGDYGIRVGKLPCGALNKISDVDGVRVGHSTIDEGGRKTGVTVVMPSEANPFINKLACGAYVLNGFGKSVGTIQIEELGTLESPIAFTSTLNVGKVSDALVEYMVSRCEGDGIALTSINPAVLECNDGRINRIADRAVGRENVFEAIASASADFDEGDIGGGKGMICFGLKGGIGSASRLVRLDKRDYTVGILVQTNFGALNDLTVGGKNIGREIAKNRAADESENGSIVAVMATDIPMSGRQLKRAVKRISVGLSRLGSYIGQGSGEVFFGFSTANVYKAAEERDIIEERVINEERMNGVFRAVAEATEEAVLNSMLCAAPTVAADGKKIESLSEYIGRYI